MTLGYKYSTYEDAGSGSAPPALGDESQCSFFYDGASPDIVNWGDILDTEFGTGQFALGMVFRRLGTGDIQNVFSKWVAAGNQRSFLVRFTASDTIQAFVSNNGSTAVNTATTASFTDTLSWHSVVVVVDTAEAVNADRVKIYVDGTSEALSAPSGTWATPFNSTADLCFGNDMTGGGSPIHGYVNQTFVLGYAPTASEVSTWHNSGQPLWALNHFSDVQLMPDVDNAVFDGILLQWDINDLSANAFTGNTENDFINSGDRDCNENPYV